MPLDDHSIDPAQGIPSDQVDLSLTIPDDFDLSAIFPDDRMFRLHPNWFIHSYTQEKNRFSASMKDYVTEKPFEIKGEINYPVESDEVLSIILNAPFQLVIRFFFKNKSLHVQTVSQKEIESTDPILLWIRSIREYIRLYVKTTPVTLGFRLLMNKMILQMNPSQRKICMMLAKITAVEVLVIVLIVVGYKIFVLG